MSFTYSTISSLNIFFDLLLQTCFFMQKKVFFNCWIEELCLQDLHRSINIHFGLLFWDDAITWEKIIPERLKLCLQKRLWRTYRLASIGWILCVIRNVFKGKLKPPKIFRICFMDSHVKMKLESSFSSDLLFLGYF